MLCVATFASYHPAWNGKPIWDDDNHITRQELRTFDGLLKIWMAPGVVPQYYPVVHSVFWLASRIWSELPLGYHLLNILLHIYSALLLFRILKRLQISGAWLAAWIFALHPLQVESVAWITELKNTLSGVFFLSTALIYLKFDKTRKRRLYMAAALLFILGLLSKSVIATLPVSLLAVFWWKRSRIDWKRDVAPLVPFLIIGILFGLFTAWVERKFIGAEGEEFNLTYIERCLIAGRVFWFYLEKILFPFNLMFIYPRWNVNAAVWWQYLFLAGAMAFTVVLWVVRKHSRAPMAALVYYIITIFPVLGFMNVYPFRFSFVADHFQYLACISPIVLSVASLGTTAGLLRGKHVRIFFGVRVAAVVLIALLGIMTWNQCGMYVDKKTHYKEIIKKNPGCWLAHNNLGLLYMSEGLLKQAIWHFRKAVDIDKRQYEALNNCGIALMRLGRHEEAVEYYTGALQVNPDFIVARYNLGRILIDMERAGEAVLHINAISVYAATLVKAGYVSDAISLFERALELAKASGSVELVDKITDDIKTSYRLSGYRNR